MVTAPTIAARPASFDNQALQSFSGTLAIPGYSTLALPTYNFTEGVKVQIKISGSITVLSDSRAPYVNAPSLSLDGGGIWGGGQCSLKASVVYGDIYNQAIAYSPSACTYPRTMQDFVTTAVVTGSGTATRDGPIPLDHPLCDTIVCHTYVAGGHTITITPLEADLFVAATFGSKTGKSVFVPAFTPSNYYQYVHFAESTLPAGMPMKVLSRAWRMADPNNSSGGTGNSNFAGTCIGNPNATPPIYPGSVCDVAIKESGVMTTTTRVNGVVHTDSACVQCAVSDSIVNAQVVRNKMMQISDSSYGTGPVSNRKEHVMAIIQDTVSGMITTQDMPTTIADQCQSKWSYITDYSFLQPTEKVLAYAHTHPQYQNESYGCIGRAPTNGAPGGSTDDWKTLKKIVNDPFYVTKGWHPPMYIIANDNVYKMDWAKGPGPDRRPMMRWDTGRCAWIRFAEQ
jgi:hypothetical protein